MQHIKELAAEYKEDLSVSHDLSSLDAELDHWLIYTSWTISCWWLAKHNFVDFVVCCGKACALHCTSPAANLHWPVTTCSAECSISARRCLKTYLRSTMRQESLSSLALLYIHYTTNTSKDEVITVFVKKDYTPWESFFPTYCSHNTLNVHV